MKLSKRMRLVMVLIGVTSIVSLIHYFGSDLLTLERLQFYHKPLEQFVHKYFFLSSIIYVVVFVSLASLSLPVITPLLLLAGLLFPLAWALVITPLSFFLHCYVMVTAVCYLFQDRIMRHYQHQLEKLNKNIEKKGLIYIVFLRMSLLFPSPLVNMAAGITTINAFLFSLISCLSTFHIITMVVYSGRLLVSIATIWDLYSHTNAIILVSFALLSMVPLWLTRDKKPS